MTKLFFLSIFLLVVSFESQAACTTDSTTIGTVQATIVGIEYHENCTYLLLGNDVVSSLTNHDSALFEAGRFTYLSIDPTNQEAYKIMLTLATTALVSQIKVYAHVTSRHARVNRLSLSRQNNSSQ